MMLNKGNIKILKNNLKALNFEIAMKIVVV